MLMQLFNYAGLPNVIDKNLLTIASIDGAFRQPISFMDPVCDIDGRSSTDIEGSTLQDLLTQSKLNYIKVDGKNYFITDYEIGPQHLIKLSLHLDVLTTYKLKISELQVLMDRTSTGRGDGFDITDSQHPISSKVDISINNFPVTISDTELDGTYVMVTSQNLYTTVTP